MKPTADLRSLNIALIGNPNTGKSTLFNALCGLRQRVGNYPGVTVEKKLGQAKFLGRTFRIFDLPGSYSLSPRSPDEMVAVDVLLGRRTDTDRPDAIVCILDASNLERNLYLLSQVLELGLPTVLALNMVDVARDKGRSIDMAALRRRLPIPVVEMQAHRKIGLEELKQAIVEVIHRPPDGPPPSPFPEFFQQQVTELERHVSANGKMRLPRYLVERLLLDTSGYLARAGLPGVDERLLEEIQAARQRLGAEGLAVPGVEAAARFRWAGEVTCGIVQQGGERTVNWSDRIDRVLTDKRLGTVVFALAMLLMFQAVFSVAEPASLAFEAANRALGDLISERLPDGALRSLLTHGVVEGVGGVLAFLPQILVLFFFIGVLEDCGYMARGAYLMDRLMSWLGLSGKSFIPLLSSFACAIPGIMSARVIDNPRDRLITVLIAPLMSCSARLPVYTLLIGAFIPDRRFAAGLLGLRGLTMFALYGVGILAAAGVALMLRKTILRGEAPPFIMELPPYKCPGLRLVLWRMLDRGWDFLRHAGTLILAVTVLVWAAAYFPRTPPERIAPLLAQRAALQASVTRLELIHPAAGASGELARLRTQLQSVEAALEGEQLRNSYPRQGRPPGRTRCEAVGLGLAHRLRCDRLFPRPRSGDCDAGCDLRPGRRRKRPHGHTAGDAPKGHLGRQ